jgi:hypothetical protein
MGHSEEILRNGNVDSNLHVIKNSVRIICSCHIGEHGSQQHGIFLLFVIYADPLI